MFLSCCKVGKPLVSFVLSGSSSHGNNPSCQLAARISVCVVFDQSTVYIYICLLPPDLFGFRIHIFFEAELFVSLLLLLCNSEKFHPLPLPPALHALIIVLNTLRPRQDGRDKMTAIFQTPFSNAFSSMKMFEFGLKFHWSLFPGVQLTIFQHWFR